MGELCCRLGIDDDPCLTVSTWGRLEWYGDALSKRRYKSRGFNPAQTRHGRETRLGRLDRYVLNYIMFDRLNHYGYPRADVRWWDSLLHPSC